MSPIQITFNELMRQGYFEDPLNPGTHQGYSSHFMCFAIDGVSTNQITAQSTMTREQVMKYMDQFGIEIKI